MTEYMILNHTDPNGPGPVPGTPEFEEFMGRWMAYNQMLIDGGHWVSGASLAPPDIATTVSKTDGTVTATTDGPYSEAKEQVGGYYLIKAADLDEALDLAGKMPVENGHLEVRPVAFRPDA
ncbi:MAG: YciI family protein [Actinomycetota bacterium]